MPVKILHWLLILSQDGKFQNGTVQHSFSSNLEYHDTVNCVSTHDLQFSFQMVEVV